MKHILASFLLIGCVLPAPNHAPSVTYCKAACERIEALKCFKTSTPSGAACLEVCENTEQSGYTTMHPRCVALARSCAEVDRVSRKGCDP
jgi:hypothetical protein